MKKSKVNKGSLSKVLEKIAKQLSLDPKQLQEAANQAPYAANRPDGRPWPSGTGSENEKRIVYALAYVMQAVDIVDLGTRWGSIAIQLASATKDNGIMGQVYGVDLGQYIGGTKHKVGKFIPDDLNVELYHNGAVEYLAGSPDNQYDFIFEDTAHTAEVTHLIYEQAKNKLAPGGIIISHDVCIPRWASAIREGFEMADVDPELYLVDGDGCGLSIWQKPKENPYISVDYGASVSSYNWNIGEGKVVDESIPAPIPPEIEPEIEVPEELVTEPEKPKKKRRTKKKNSIEDA
jgi:predicted O-methyltransferase YrrM